MFRNINWRTALKEALKVFLAALLGGSGMYLSLNESSDPIDEFAIVRAHDVSVLG